MFPTRLVRQVFRVYKPNQLLFNNYRRTALSRRCLFGMNTKTEAGKETKQDQAKTEESSETKQDQPIENNAQAATNEPTDQEVLSEREKELTAENIKLTDLIKEIDDKYKRALADAENTRIRMRRQAEEAKIYGIQNFCKDLLDVADVLHLAVETVPQEKVKSADDIFKNLFEGVQMTEKQLQSIFKRHGLSQINPVGQKFDPNEHHALFEAQEPGKEPGTVAVVTKIGYKLHERTIRPAMVGVIKASK